MYLGKEDLVFQDNLVILGHRALGVGAMQLILGDSCSVLTSVEANSEIPRNVDFDI